MPPPPPPPARQFDSPGIPLPEVEAASRASLPRRYVIARGCRERVPPNVVDRLQTLVGDDVLEMGAHPVGRLPVRPNAAVTLDASLGHPGPERVLNADLDPLVADKHLAMTALTIAAPVPFSQTGVQHALIIR